MLIGAALAFVWAPWRLTGNTATQRAARARRLSIVGVVGVVWFFLNAGSSTRGSTAAASSSSRSFAAVLIAATVHPASRLVAAAASRSRSSSGSACARTGSTSGTGRSTWSPARTPTCRSPGIPLLVFRLGLTFVAAALSYKYVEEPIRHGAIGRRWAQFRGPRGERRRQLGTGFAGRRERPRGRDPRDRGRLQRRAGPTPGRPACPTQAALVLKPDHHDGRSQRPRRPRPRRHRRRHRGHHHRAGARRGCPTVTALGDSVMLGAAQPLTATINGAATDGARRRRAQNRQFAAGVDELQGYRTPASSATRSSSSSAPTAPSTPATSTA